MKKMNIAEAMLCAESDLNKIIEETELRHKTKWIKQRKNGYYRNERNIIRNSKRV